MPIQFLLSLVDEARQTAPGILEQMPYLFLVRRLFHGFYFYGVQMDIPRKNGEIAVFVHEEAFISSLIERPDTIMSSVEVASVNDVEVAHECGEVALGCLEKEMKVIGHEDVAVKFDGMDIERLEEHLLKSFSVRIVPKDCLFVVAPAGDTVHRAGVFDTEGSGHEQPYQN